MKKLLAVAIVLTMMVPAFAGSMVEGKFGAGLALGNGASFSQIDNGNQLGLGINLQYGIEGLTFLGHFNYHLPLAPKLGDDIDGEESSIMDFGVHFLGTVGDGPFVGYAGLGFFYCMMNYTAGTGVDEVAMNTLGLTLDVAADYFFNDMIAIGGSLSYPISLGSDDGGDDDYNGAVNANGMMYKVNVKFFF
ncbi:hypothetical protein K8R78_07880 [bacterium]|nr:hypothetical protein [bacterium]